MSDRPWLCPQDTCPAPRHDDWQGFRRGCGSGSARESNWRYRKAIRLGTHVSRQVPALGSRRRLQALVAIGWSFKAIGDEIGWHQTWTSSFTRGLSSPDWCTSHTAGRVAELYDRLCMTPGGRTSWHRTRALRVAERHGWVPPLAWTDIDNPAERPDRGGVDRTFDVNVVEAVVAERLTWGELTYSDQDHLVTVLLARGWTTAQIAERAGTDPVAVRRVTDRMRNRQKRSAA